MRWEDLRVGQREEFGFRLESGHLERFAALSGDTNPLHREAGFARERGFPGPVAHGMLLAALFSRLVGTRLPGESALILSCGLKFRRPVVPPEDLLVSGEVVHLSEATRTAEIRVEIAANGERKATGTYQVKVT